jgi:hypothetical protein
MVEEGERILMIDYGQLYGFKKLCEDMRSCDGKWKEFRRVTEIYPRTYNGRGDSKDLVVLLFGTKGTVQYKAWTMPYAGEDAFMAVDKGYHSPRPLWEGQEIIEDHCKYLEGLPCYYDGSGYGAELLTKKYQLEGLEAFWQEMEEFYRYQFEERDLMVGELG